MLNDDEFKDDGILDAQMNIFEYEAETQQEKLEEEKEMPIDGQIDLFSIQENINDRGTQILKKDEQNDKNNNVNNQQVENDNFNQQKGNEIEEETHPVLDPSIPLPKKHRKSKMNNGNNGSLLFKTQSIEEVLHNSMIPYSEFVLMDRALPRVEDGLKPVQRRILYSMMELGLTPDKAYKKSARIVGECLGKYHPHGDTSVYDAMVRMAQPFNMRGCLVQGHGNFGSMDGDSAAAMRYTEAKLAPLALELLRDIDKNTVPFSLNFDDTLQEPDILPGRYPNLLVNGAMGIAVGLATNIPPHNLAEVIDGTVALIDDPDMTLKDMMKIIKGPDFPTGGIVSKDDLYQAYETGKGKITVRAKVAIEKGENGKTDIVITEFPYQKNKATLLAKIADIREDKKGILLGISDIRDESDRNGIRAVITVKNGFDAEKILAVLYRYSELQSTFGINMVAIADGKPKQLGLMDILHYYINYQIDVIVRRTKFDLDAAKDRMHILQGLYVAIQNIDEVVAIIKRSASTQEAKATLRERFDLSEKQAQAILDMRLARLTSLEVYKIEQEMKELDALIKKLTAILNSKKLQQQTLKDELLEIKNNYKMERVTKVVKGFDELDVNQIMQENKPVEECVVLLTRAGTIKRITTKQYDSALKEFTPGISEPEIHYNTIHTYTDKVLIGFTNKGNACRIKVEDIKEVKWREKGVTLRSICKELDVDECIVAMYEINEENAKKQLLFITNQGMLKLSEFVEYDVQKQKFTAVKLKDVDGVVSVSEFDKKKNVIMVTEKGMILHCDSNDIPLQGRSSQGVKGIVLNDKDYVAFGSQVTKTDTFVLLTKYGFSKRLKVANLDTFLSRARKGVKVFDLPTKDYVLFGAVSKDDTIFALKVDGVFDKKTLMDFYADTRQGKGKSITKSKGGDKVEAIFEMEE